MVIRLSLLLASLSQETLSVILPHTTSGGGYKLHINSTGTTLSCTEGSVAVASDIYNSSLQLVEMCTSDGMWSPVCDYEWTINDVAVVCRELGYTFPSECTMCMLDMIIIMAVQFFTVDMKLLDKTYSYLTDKTLDCNGNENNLISCLQKSPVIKTCNFVLVECNNPLNAPITVTGVPVPTLANGTVEDKEMDNGTTDEETIGDVAMRDGGVPTAVFVGVVVVLIVIIALIAGCVLLVVHCWKKNKT